MAFEDSGMLFELRAWTNTLTHRKGRLISSLNFAIYAALRHHQIEIPFPQRDIRIRTTTSPLPPPD
jgi:small-conductance mechanosensitive channel